jgi:hypothetical protein
MGTGLNAPVQGPSPRGGPGGFAERQVFLLEGCPSIRAVNTVARTSPKANERYPLLAFLKPPIKHPRLSSRVLRPELDGHQ